MYDARRGLGPVLRREARPALAGLIAAGVSFGITEIFAGLISGGPSLIIAVGSGVIDLFAEVRQGLRHRGLWCQRQARAPHFHRRDRSGPGRGGRGGRNPKVLDRAGRICGLWHRGRNCRNRGAAALARAGVDRRAAGDLRRHVDAGDAAETVAIGRDAAAPRVTLG